MNRFWKACLSANATNQSARNLFDRPSNFNSSYNFDMFRVVSQKYSKSPYRTARPGHRGTNFYMVLGLDSIVRKRPCFSK